MLTGRLPMISGGLERIHVYLGFIIESSIYLDTSLNLYSRSLSLKMNFKDHVKDNVQSILGLEHVIDQTYQIETIHLKEIHYNSSCLVNNISRTYLT